MNEPIDELYLVWLYHQVGNPRVKSPRKTYWTLFKQLSKIEFVWFVPNDDSRAADGKELRREFLIDAEIPEIDRDWMNLGCSFIEMMIALSRRLEFQTETPAEAWFWHLMENIGLHGYTDAYEDSSEPVEEITNRIIWRTYAANGNGGLFPLREPNKDQTKVELWFQLCSYVLENS